MDNVKKLMDLLTYPQMSLSTSDKELAASGKIKHQLVHIHNKFDNTGEDMEALISIGTIGLIKAIESFSPDKGTKLATFAADVLSMKS